jgi:hypothetical protein
MDANANVFSRHMSIVLNAARSGGRRATLHLVDRNASEPLEWRWMLDGYTSPSPQDVRVYFEMGGLSVTTHELENGHVDVIVELGRRQANPT